MVIRVWIERDGGFRARLTETLDLSGREERVAVVSNASQVLAHVQRWLEDFQRPSTRANLPVPTQHARRGPPWTRTGTSYQT